MKQFALAILIVLLYGCGSTHTETRITSVVDTVHVPTIEDWLDGERDPADTSFFVAVRTDPVTHDTVAVVKWREGRTDSIYIRVTPPTIYLPRIDTVTYTTPEPSHFWENVGLGVFCFLAGVAFSQIVIPLLKKGVGIA